MVRRRNLRLAAVFVLLVSRDAESSERSAWREYAGRAPLRKASASRLTGTFQGEIAMKHTSKLAVLLLAGSLMAAPPETKKPVPIDPVGAPAGVVSGASE